MADNVDVTEGSGAVIAADEIAGIKYQRVKLALGAPGEAADLDSGQQTMDRSVPVVLASDQPPIAISSSGAPTALALHSVTCALANTEYTLALPAVCRRLCFRGRTPAPLRWSLAAGKVALPNEPYGTLGGGEAYDSGAIELATGTLYVASPTAGAVVEVEVWS